MAEKHKLSSPEGQTLAPAPIIELPIEAPPDGGYGWVQVGVSFTINAFTWGQTAVYFSLFAFPSRS